MKDKCARLLARTERLGTQGWLIIIFAVALAAANTIGIVGIVNASSRAHSQEIIINRLQDQIGDISDANTAEACRVSLSASAQSELLRGNAALLTGLVQVARNSLSTIDIAGIEASAKKQLEEAARRDTVIDQCPTH